MNITDKLFLNSIHKKADKKADNLFTILFSYLGDIKSLLHHLIFNKINIEAKVKVNYGEVVDKLSEVDKTIQSVKKDLNDLSTKECGHLDRLNKTTSEIPSKIVIPKAEKVVIPSVFSLKESGLLVKRLEKISQEIENLQTVTSGIKLTVPDNSSVITSKLDEVRQAISRIKPSNTTFDDKSILKALNEVKKAIGDIHQSEMEFPESISINNFPPQKVPQPVTHISINSLSGSVHQTATSVTSTLTQLPSYGVLDNRRAIVFYNNSSTVTVYIGGSTVTSSTGLPLEPKSYSPSFDSGPLQKWYGITSAGTADVRVIEIPDEASGR